jgi:hypothetical protein
MDEPNLHELLAELHGELVAVRTVDSRTRDELRHLADHIRSVLDDEASRSGAEGYRGLQDRLAQAATAFEASHPQLARRIEATVNTLAMLNL